MLNISLATACTVYTRTVCVLALIIDVDMMERVNVDTSEQMFAFPADFEFQTTDCQTRALFILLD